jgi:hypothetical protein
MKVSDEEMTKWKALAKDNNSTLANVVRTKLNGMKLKKKIDPGLLRHIAQIGNNLNQIARHLNSGKKLETLSYLISIRREIETYKNDN